MHQAALHHDGFKDAANFGWQIDDPEASVHWESYSADNNNNIWIDLQRIRCYVVQMSFDLALKLWINEFPAFSYPSIHTLSYCIIFLG